MIADSYYNYYYTYFEVAVIIVAVTTMIPIVTHPVKSSSIAGRYMNIVRVEKRLNAFSQIQAFG